MPPAEALAIRQPRDWLSTLAGAAAQPYRRAGRFAWHFARGKLLHDPAFGGLLQIGGIPDGGRVLDLGCGQALLAPWLQQAAERHRAGDWPTGWPAPPRGIRYRGIELMPRDVARARRALGDTAQIEVGDIRDADLGACDAVVILDVLHYFDQPAQERLLQRIHASLASDGVLFLRVGDAAAGWRFHFSNWVDRVVTRVRGHRVPPVYCRPLNEWQALLQRLGFDVSAIPMSAGTPFANVLLVARKLGSAPGC